MSPFLVIFASQFGSTKIVLKINKKTQHLSLRMKKRINNVETILIGY